MFMRPFVPISPDAGAQACGTYRLVRKHPVAEPQLPALRYDARVDNECCCMICLQVAWLDAEVTACCGKTVCEGCARTFREKKLQEWRTSEGYRYDESSFDYQCTIACPNCREVSRTFKTAPNRSLRGMLRCEETRCGGCGKGMPFQQTAAHFASECPAVKYPCYFAERGCKWVGAIIHPRTSAGQNKQKRAYHPGCPFSDAKAEEEARRLVREHDPHREQKIADVKKLLKRTSQAEGGSSLASAASGYPTLSPVALAAELHARDLVLLREEAEHIMDKIILKAYLQKVGPVAAGLYKAGHYAPARREAEDQSAAEELLSHGIGVVPEKVWLHLLRRLRGTLAPFAQWEKKHFLHFRNVCVAVADQDYVCADEDGNDSYKCCCGADYDWVALRMYEFVLRAYTIDSWRDLPPPYGGPTPPFPIQLPDLSKIACPSKISAIEFESRDVAPYDGSRELYLGDPGDLMRRGKALSIAEVAAFCHAARKNFRRKYLGLCGEVDQLRGHTNKRSLLREDDKAALEATTPLPEISLLWNTTGRSEDAQIKRMRIQRQAARSTSSALHGQKQDESEAKFVYVSRRTPRPTEANLDEEEPQPDYEFFKDLAELFFNDTSGAKTGISATLLRIYMNPEPLQYTSEVSVHSCVAKMLVHYLFEATLRRCFSLYEKALDEAEVAMEGPKPKARRGEAMSTGNPSSSASSSSRDWTTAASATGPNPFADAAAQSLERAKTNSGRFGASRGKSKNESVTPSSSSQQHSATEERMSDVGAVSSGAGGLGIGTGLGAVFRNGSGEKSCIDSSLGNEQPRPAALGSSYYNSAGTAEETLLPPDEHQDDHDRNLSYTLAEERSGQGQLRLRLPWDAIATVLDCVFDEKLTFDWQAVTSLDELFQHPDVRRVFHRERLVLAGRDETTVCTGPEYEFAHPRRGRGRRPFSVKQGTAGAEQSAAPVAAGGGFVGGSRSVVADGTDHATGVESLSRAMEAFDSDILEVEPPQKKPKLRREDGSAAGRQIEAAAPAPPQSCASLGSSSPAGRPGAKSLEQHQDDPYEDLDWLEDLLHSELDEE